MEHYALDEWADFARGLITGTGANAMREHLVAGCSECISAEEFCRKLYEVGRTASRVSVPPIVLFRAQSIFSTLRDRRVLRAAAS